MHASALVWNLSPVSLCCVISSSVVLETQLCTADTAASRLLPVGHSMPPQQMFGLYACLSVCVFEAVGI